MLNEIDLSRTDLNLLTLFEVVMMERHVGRSAERLNLSPSAISHGLGRLRRLLNDPLFIRHPKGLNPTERALLLAPHVAEILAGARALIGQARPFDPARSERRFIIGAVDAIGAVLVPPLLAEIGRIAPCISIGVRTLFPQEATAALDSGLVHAALVPEFGYPARLSVEALYIEEFVFAVRRGHSLCREPSLEAFAARAHLLVSSEGAKRGFVDDVLEQHGLRRRIALSVPSFLWALAVLGETELVAAMPQRLVAAHGDRFGVVGIQAPVRLAGDPICFVTPQVALRDPAMEWLAAQVRRVAAQVT